MYNYIVFIRSCGGHLWHVGSVCSAGYIMLGFPADVLCSVECEITFYPPLVSLLIFPSYSSRVMADLISIVVLYDDHATHLNRSFPSLQPAMILEFCGSNESSEK